MAAFVLSGDGSDGRVGEAIGDSVVVRVVDGDGDAVSGVHLRLEVAEGGGSVSPAVPVTDADGVARSAWTLGPVAGEQRLEVGVGEKVALAVVSAHAHPGPPHELRVLPEEVTIPAGVPFELESRVTDVYGNRIASIAVEWESDDAGVALVTPDGRVTGLAIGTTAVEARPAGEASPADAEIVDALAEAAARHHREGHEGGRSSIEIVEGDGAYVSATSGDGQTGTTGETLPEELGVRVTDAEGDPIRQVDVDWTVLSGDGSVSETVTRTDGQGYTSVAWTLGPETGTQRVEARVGDLGAVTFSATAYGDDSGDDGTGDDGTGDDGTSDDGGSGDDGSGDDDSGDGDSGDESSGDPDTVSDLSVMSTDESSASLRFTQVADGAGGAATYEIRYTEHPIGWGWGDATLVAEGSCASPVAGTEPGETLDCTVEGLAPSTQYDFQLVSYRDDADGSRSFGDLSNVATGTTDGSAPPPPAEGGNEPSAHGLIASHDFQCIPGDGCQGEVGEWWTRSRDVEAGRVSLVDDGLEILFPEGWEDGASPARFDGWSTSGSGDDEYNSVYVRIEMRLVGPDWENQSVLTKHFYLAFGDNERQNHGFFGQSHNGGQDIRSAFALNPWLSEAQEDGTMPGGGAVRRDANVDEGLLFTAGDWHEVEVLMDINDPGVANGRARLWIDGVLTHDVRDLRLRGSSDDMGFHWFQFTPVYGGVSGDVKTRDDRMHLRSVYLSGAK